ncbi:hypothetical protein ACFYNO_06545 [Kitasatospora sp. NPDC006697]|uniref:hypothetical protein n=1 Tax=Kitasatospora sp. NPDC006697 TaxID=3364020 RepID=UPI003694B516
MTEDKDRPGQDGADEGTPMERLLREALAARAAQVGPHDLRPAEPPGRKLRRLHPVYSVVLPLGLAASLAVGYLGFNSHSLADHSPAAPAASVSASHSAEATSVASATPSPSASLTAQDGSAPAMTSQSASAPAGSPTTGGSAATSSSSPTLSGAPVAPVGLGPVQSYRGMTFRLPTGWSMATESPTLGFACLNAPAVHRTTDTLGRCGVNSLLLVIFNTVDDAAEGEDPTMDQLDSKGGWAHQPYCYDPSNPHGTGTQTLLSYSETKTTLPTGQADLATWNVSCDNGGKFTARMWGFRKSQVMAVVQGIDPKYEAGLQAVLGSLDISAVPQSLPKVSMSTSLPAAPVPDDGSKVQFSVTYTNTSSTRVAEMVAQISLTPAPSGSTLEQQKDDGTWLSMPPDTTGADAVLSNLPVFALAPGASRTVNFRVSFAPSAGFAQQQVSLYEQARLKFDDTQATDYGSLGTATQPLPTVAK